MIEWNIKVDALMDTAAKHTAAAAAQMQLMRYAYRLGHWGLVIASLQQMNAHNAMATAAMAVAAREMDPESATAPKGMVQ